MRRRTEAQLVSAVSEAPISRILIVTRNFPPQAGGMERLLGHVYAELSRDHEIAVVAPIGSEVSPKTAGPTARCHLSPLPVFLVQAHYHAIRLAVRFRPDLVLAGSGLVAPAALLASRVVGSKAICYLHGLDLVAQSRIYQALFVPAIRSFDRLLVNSRFTASLARDKDVDASKISILHPGVAIPDRIENVAESFRREIGLAANARILLSVGRFARRKGLAQFIARVLVPLVAESPETHLVIIGDEPRHALMREAGTADEIATAVRETGLDRNVVFLGRANDDLLGRAYAASDLHVFPVLNIPGDVEGFGMVALEAAAHGLHTVAFAVGGVTDAVNDPVSGRLIAPGDYAGFIEAVRQQLRMRRDATRIEQCRDFAAQLSWPRFGERLRALVAGTMR